MTTQTGSSATSRGCFYLIIALVFVAVVCIAPLVLLTSTGSAVTLPVITVPPEKYLENWPSKDLSSIFVNTFMGGALMADIMVILFAVFAYRWSRGWTKKVPGRGQAAAELVVDGLWGLTKQQAGTSARVKNVLFPVVGTLFVFLLAANWGKLIPGVESVGILHCAAYKPVAFNGLPVKEGQFIGPYFSLRNDQLLNIGTLGTKESYEQCESFISHHGADVKELDPFYDKAVTYVTVEGDTLESIAAAKTAEAAKNATQDLPPTYNPDDVVPAYISETFEGYEGWKHVEFTADEILALNSGLKTAAVEDSHGEKSAPELTVTTPLEPGQTVTVRPELLGAEATTFKNQLFTVAPFVRGAATDLNLTLALALFSFCLIQYFGLSTLGPNYLQKFVNLRAIGDIANRPLGAIDFVAGLFEIVSELGKIISLSFRLFGALFAGSILFAVFLFLFGSILPAVILMLEVIVGGAQAAVFAILTLIFCSQAMVSHGHDDHGHGHDEHDEVGEAGVNVYDGGHGQQAHGVSA